MMRCMCFVRNCRRSKICLLIKISSIIILVALLCLFTFTRVKLKIEHRKANVFYKIQQSKLCQENIEGHDNRTKIIIFWTKIFKATIDEHFLNGHLFTPYGRCQIKNCRITTNRQDLCNSNAIIFHARGGIRMNDMPRARSPHQRYILLTKEPPYKTTAIVGHLNYFFNWTATYRTDSDITYRYFDWRKKDSLSTEKTNRKSLLSNRQARATVMISNCYSENNREDYIERLGKILPVTRIGYCSKNKCQNTRYECLQKLADRNPFYLAFENSLCNDYVTEKYSNAIINSRMIPVVFSKNSNLYIPNSYIDANQFASPEELGQYLVHLVTNATAFDSYFQWREKYELIIPDENDYLCEICKKLNDPHEPYKVYDSMQKWLYEDAKCQQWISELNSTVNVPLDKTMDYEESWF